MEQSVKSACIARKRIAIPVQMAYNRAERTKGEVLMAGSTNVTIRMDADVKAQAEALFGELGMNLTTAFNIFVRQSLRKGGIPFEVALDQPNKETMAAMLEAERIAHDPSVKHYADVEEALRALKE